MCCKWGVVQQRPTPDLALSPCSFLTAHGALVLTAFRSVTRRGNTSLVSSCFLALFSCWFSTRNLRDLCKTRLCLVHQNNTSPPSFLCPCPPQSCSVCGVCWWAGCHIQPPSQSWSSARFWSLQRFSSHLRSSSIWASLLKAVTSACR